MYAIRSYYALISVMRDSLQCIAGKNLQNGEIAFGQTQKPAINDYADGVDTMEFLLKV